MPSPTDRRYSPTHEWHKLEDGLVVIGLTRFAVDELTDVTYVDYRLSSGPVKAGESFGEIESVKTTSEMYSAIDGEIVQTNSAVVDNPALVNEDPWEAGWLLKVRPSDPAQLDTLMDAAAYDTSHGG